MHIIVNQIGTVKYFMYSHRSLAGFVIKLHKHAFICLDSWFYIGTAKNLIRKKINFPHPLYP